MKDTAVQDTLARLRRSIAKINREAWPEPSGVDCVPLGPPAMDGALGGGLARAALHEVFAAGMAESGAANGFGLSLALRFCAEGRRIVWVQQDIDVQEYGVLHPPGLAAFGADPSAFVVVRVRTALEALRAAHEALRCAALGSVIMELRGAPKALDLTASQRLARAAAQSGVTLIMMRTDAQAQPSAATSRWQVSALPSVRLEANAPGPPAFDAALVRHRAGLPPRNWHVEWDREQLVFREPTLSGAVVSLPFNRPAAATGLRRAG